MSKKHERSSRSQLESGKRCIFVFSIFSLPKRTQGIFWAVANRGEQIWKKWLWKTCRCSTGCPAILALHINSSKWHHSTGFVLLGWFWNRNFVWSFWRFSKPLVKAEYSFFLFFPSFLFTNPPPSAVTLVFFPLLFHLKFVFFLIQNLRHPKNGWKCYIFFFKFKNLIYWSH